MSRFAPLLSAVALVSASVAVTSAVAAPASPPKTRVGVDDATAVSFSLTVRTLVVTLRPVNGQPNALTSTVPGTEVVLACRGKNPRTGRVATATSAALWPAGSARLETRLSRNVSAGTKWCVMERPDGGDIAVTLKLRVPNPNAPAPTTA